MPRYRFDKTIFSQAQDRLMRMLRQAREDAGLTQMAAAELLGCRQTFISKVECGERHLDVREFVTFYRAYGVEPTALLRRFLKEAGLAKI